MGNNLVFRPRKGLSIYTDVLYRDQLIYQIADYGSSNYRIYFLSRYNRGKIWDGLIRDPESFTKDHFKKNWSLDMDLFISRYERFKGEIRDMGLRVKDNYNYYEYFPSYFIGCSIYYRDHFLYNVETDNIKGSVLLRDSNLLKGKSKGISLMEAKSIIKKGFEDMADLRKIWDGEDLYGE